MEHELSNFLKVWVTVFASLIYCYAIGKNVPKGKSRFFLLLPIKILFFFLLLPINSPPFILVVSLHFLLLGLQISSFYSLFLVRVLYRQTHQCLCQVFLLFLVYPSKSRKTHLQNHNLIKTRILKSQKRPRNLH